MRRTPPLSRARRQAPWPSRSVPRRRHLLVGLGLGALTLAATGWLTGCGSVLGPREVLVTTEQLTERLGRRFPMEKRWLQVMDITLGAPALRMLPEENRIATAVPMAIRSRLLGGPAQGQVTLSFGLRLEPSDLTLRLTDLAVDRIEVPGLAPSAARTLTGLSGWLAEEALKDVVVHQLAPTDLRSVDRLGLKVDQVRVTPRGLAVRLVPRD